MAKVSVIVPVYNGKKYINKCVNSILRQTFKDIEIILVDDGSTDNTLDILREYEKKFPNVKVISSINLGAGGARNIGLDASHGEYILFVDADDFLREDMIEVLYKNAVSNDADIVRCGRCTYFENIKLDSYNSSYYNEYKKIINPKKEKDYVFNEMPTVWNKLIRRNLFDDIRFREHLKWEDGPVIRPITAKANKIVFLYDRMYMYRINLNNTTIRDFLYPTEKVLDVFTGLDDLKYNFKKIGLYSEFEQIIHDDAVFTSLLRVQNAGLWFKLSKEDRIKLTNALVNIIEVKYGDWKNNPPYLYYKSRNKFFNATMTYIEDKVLDLSLRKENNLEKIYSNVNHIFGK